MPFRVLTLAVQYIEKTTSCYNASEQLVTFMVTEHLQKIASSHILKRRGSIYTCEIVTT